MLFDLFAFFSFAVLHKNKRSEKNKKKDVTQSVCVALEQQQLNSFNKK